MESDRRDFLKRAGLGAIVGLGAVSALNVAGKNDAKASSSNDEPTSGTRWGMVIDMSKCEKDDYKKIIDACHIPHNVPDHGNPKDEVKWIWTDPYENVFPNKSHQFLSSKLKGLDFLVLCNHCKHPPCVRVCPTQATFKRKDGIVLMDFHRCIGCRFCMAACPYGSRSFNWKDPRPAINKITAEFPTRERGVVEKCNFCAERLAEGKQPYCAEACPEAITFGDLNDPNSEVRKKIDANRTIQRRPAIGAKPSVFYIV